MKAEYLVFMLLITAELTSTNIATTKLAEFVRSNSASNEINI